MSTLLIILLGTVLIQNSVTLSAAAAGTVGTLRQEVASLAMVSLNLTLASLLGFAVETYSLAPYGLDYLRTLLLATLLALVLALLHRLLSKRSSKQKSFLGYFTEHCAAWGMALFSAWNLHQWSEALSYGLGAGVGLSFLDAAFRMHRSRFATAAVPFVFRGIPLDLITAGLMALALYGFVGF